MVYVSGSWLRDKRCKRTFSLIYWWFWRYLPTLSISKFRWKVAIITNFDYLRFDVRRNICLLLRRTVARKSSVGGLTLVQGLDIEILIKTPLIYSVSCFRLGTHVALFWGLSPPKPPVATELVLHQGLKTLGSSQITMVYTQSVTSAWPNCQNALMQTMGWFHTSLSNGRNAGSRSCVNITGRNLRWRWLAG